MKGSAFTNKGYVPSEAVEAEIDLDTSPIMNVMVILIPFLASVAVYTHLAALPVSLPPNVNAALSTAQGRPKLKLTIVVSAQSVVITYGERALDTLPVVSGAYDFTGLGQKLLLRKSLSESPDDIVVAVRDEVLFKNVVSIMDVCRESGFKRPGLAAATSDPGKGK